MNTDGSSVDIGNPGRRTRSRSATLHGGAGKGTSVSPNREIKWDGGEGRGTDARRRSSVGGGGDLMKGGAGKKMHGKSKLSNWKSGGRGGGADGVKILGSVGGPRSEHQARVSFVAGVIIVLAVLGIFKSQIRSDTMQKKVWEPLGALMDHTESVLPPPSEFVADPELEHLGIYDKENHIANPHFCRTMQGDARRCGDYLVRELLFPRRLDDFPSLPLILRRVLQDFDTLCSSRGFDYVVFGNLLEGLIRHGSVGRGVGGLDSVQVLVDNHVLHDLHTNGDTKKQLRELGYEVHVLAKGRALRLWLRKGYWYGFQWRWPFVDVWQMQEETVQFKNTEGKDQPRVMLFVKTVKDKNAVIQLQREDVFPIRRIGMLQVPVSGPGTKGYWASVAQASKKESEVVFNIPNDPLRVLQTIMGGWSEGVRANGWNHIENTVADNLKGMMIPVRLAQLYTPVLRAVVRFGAAERAEETASNRDMDKIDPKRSRFDVTGMELSEVYKELMGPGANTGTGIDFYNELKHDEGLKPIPYDKKLQKSVKYMRETNLPEGIASGLTAIKGNADDGFAKGLLAKQCNFIMKSVLEESTKKELPQGAVKVQAVKQIRSGSGFVMYYAFKDAFCQKRIVYSTWLRVQEEGKGDQDSTSLILCDLAMHSGNCMDETLTQKQVGMIVDSLSCRRATSASVKKR
eukprot:Nk52_evm14s227 gene=Nk52_evmTU14s227